MHVKSAFKSVPIFGPLAATISRSLKRLGFKGSADYWERRYQSGGNSGAGSYNQLAEFKAKFLNDFVDRNNIASVIEFGSGDGAQLGLANYPSYVGVDVSRTAIDQARKRFKDDPSKSFLLSSELPPGLQAELALSLDVIYHLVEAETFESYMRGLFEAASRFVIIYSSDHDEVLGVAHVRHRRFTNWVEKTRPDFTFLERVPNEFPFDEKDPENTSFADFYIYLRS